MSYPVPDSLTTLAQVKTFIGINDTSEDSNLNALITQASYLITNQCNRPFFLSSNAANPVTEYYSGTGYAWLVLNLWPVQSITSIYLDDGAFWNAASGAFATTTLLVSGTDYAYVPDDLTLQSKSAMVFRINGIWDNQWVRDGLMLASYPDIGYGNIKITYTYGFQSLPSDLVLAANLVVSRLRQMGTYGRKLASEQYEEYNYHLDPGGLWGVLDGEVAMIINKYRIQPVGIAI